MAKCSCACGCEAQAAQGKSYCDPCLKGDCVSDSIGNTLVNVSIPHRPYQSVDNYGQDAGLDMEPTPIPRSLGPIPREPGY